MKDCVVRRKFNGQFGAWDHYRHSILAFRQRLQIPFTVQIITKSNASHFSQRLEIAVNVNRDEQHKRAVQQTDSCQTSQPRSARCNGLHTPRTRLRTGTWSLAFISRPTTFCSYLYINNSGNGTVLSASTTDTVHLRWCRDPKGCCLPSLLGFGCRMSSPI